MEALLQQRMSTSHQHPIRSGWRLEEAHKKCHINLVRGWLSCRVAMGVQVAWDVGLDAPTDRLIHRVSLAEVL